MEITDSFVAKSAFVIGGALGPLPLVSLYVPSIAEPEVMLFVGLAGMAWHAAGFVMLRGLEKAHAVRSKLSSAYLTEVLAKRFPNPV